MTHSILRPRRALLAVGLLAASLALAACGSSASSTTSSSATAGTASASASTFAARRQKLAACLKQHGITLPARPAGAGAGPPGSGNGTGGGSGSGTGGGSNSGAGAGGTGRPRGFFFGGGRGGAFANPKARAAFQACASEVGLPRGRFRAGFGGGISHTTIDAFVACVRRHGYALPNPNFFGKGAVFPASIRTNAKFQAASRACVSVLRPAGAPPAPSGSGSGGTSTTG